MDANQVAQMIADSLSFSKRVHINLSNSSNGVIRFHDRTTPYIVHLFGVQ